MRTTVDLAGDLSTALDNLLKEFRKENREFAAQHAALRRSLPERVNGYHPDLMTELAKVEARSLADNPPPRVNGGLASSYGLIVALIRKGLERSRTPEGVITTASVRTFLGLPPEAPRPTTPLTASPASKDAAIKAAMKRVGLG